MNAKSLSTADATGPHAGQILRTRGPAAPTAATILLHGRGASAQDILSLADPLNVPDMLFIAPQAAGNTWYPSSFLSPLAVNQTGISSAHSVIETIISQLEKLGLTPERIAIGGFSQGACLTLDHAYHFPRRYGALFAFTGGLIGPPGTRFASSGSLEGTPTFIGANDPDPHVPWTRVEESAARLRDLGAVVDLRRYPGLPHSVFTDEIEAARALLLSLCSPNPG
ncbi:MAG: alpha/beta hydrolase [Phycisphaerales bacterium]